MTRENPKIMYGCVIAFLVLWSFSITVVQNVRAEERRPNVIVILADDLGSVDLGCYGASDMITPHVDQLAQRGLKFTQFYSAAPVCSPSRAGLITGRYPVVCGVPSNAGSQRGDKAGLPPDETTLAELFQRAGYATAHIGKWHLGYTPEMSPRAQGFQESFGHMGGCIDNYSHFFFWAGPNVHDLHRNGVEVFEDGKYFPDLMLGEASQFIDKHATVPFFMYFAMNMPHYPYQGEAKWLDRFASVPHPRKLYNAFVASQDERIGGLLRKLDALGLRENTIVVFQSDNGHSTEERAHFGGGSSGPYRGAKFSLFEGGIRLPAIISWPGHLPQNESRTQLGHACDWFPTLAELCGVKTDNLALDGKSLVPVLNSASAATPHSAVHWQVGRGNNADWAVRDGDWKLIGNCRDTSDGQHPLNVKNFLVNLAVDIGEKQDLASSHPEVLERLTRLHAEWRDTVENARP